MDKKVHYHATKLKPIVQIIADAIKKNPALLEDPNYLMAQLSRSIEGFSDQTKCLNCGASMAEYAETIDVNDALLLLNMAKIVNRKTTTEPNFTLANRIQVSASDIHHTQKCRTAKCRKLGLIARAGNSHWAITDRGFAALRGEPIPKVRVSFRNQIIDRPETMTTLAEVFADHKAKMQEKERSGGLVKGDKRDQFATYTPSDWVVIAGYHQGSII